MVIVPTPPDPKERYSYVVAHRVPLYFFGVFSTLLLLTGMGGFVAQNGGFWFYGIFAFVNAFYLFLSYFIGLTARDYNPKPYLDALGDGITAMERFPSMLPTVDVFLPCCGEDIEIILNTHYQVSKLTYPKDRLRVYVLDDGGSDGVRRSAEACGFKYISRPNRGELKKAGNLRYAFERTSGDLILILDADFVPTNDFVLSAVGFFKDPKLAVLQTPQFFRVKKEMTWVEKGAGYIQELFYRLIQVNRDHYGASICVGTCAIYRRKALEPFGGTYPIEYSEDVWTGFNLVNAGWKLKYIPVALSSGICPDTLPAFFNQQYRWAMGSISMFFSKVFWTSTLKPIQKACFLSGQLYYITTGLGVLLTALPAPLVAWTHPDKIVWYSVLFSLPSLIYGTVFMAVWSRAKWGFYAMECRIASYWAHLFALRDFLFKSRVAWAPTGAIRSNHGRFNAFVLSARIVSLAYPLALISGLMYHHALSWRAIPSISIAVFWAVIGLRATRVK